MIRNHVAAIGDTAAKQRQRVAALERKLGTDPGDAGKAMLAEERGALDNAETQAALGLRALRQRVEQGDSLLTLPGPAPSLRERVDVEERVERMAAGFGEGPARSPEADETRALRREIVRLRAQLGGS